MLLNVTSHNIYLMLLSLEGLTVTSKNGVILISGVEEGRLAHVQGNEPQLCLTVSLSRNKQNKSVKPMLV